MLIVKNPYENLLYKQWSIDEMDMMLEIRRFGEEEDASISKLLSANGSISTATALSTADAG